MALVRKPTLWERPGKVFDVSGHAGTQRCHEPSYVQRRILGFLRRDSRPEQPSSLSLTLLLDEMSNPVIHAASSQVMAIDCNRYTRAT